jgi:hypothetical protein
MVQTSAINAQVHAMKSCQKFLQRMHSIHPIGPQTHVLGCLEPFCYCMNLYAKWVEVVPLMHKFMQRNLVEIFRNEHT